MDKRKKRKKNYYKKRRKQEENANRVSAKVIISLIILLSCLLFKKYDVNIGGYNVDTMYEVLYYNQDFKDISEQVFSDMNFKDILRINSGE